MPALDVPIVDHRILWLPGGLTTGKFPINLLRIIRRVRFYCELFIDLHVAALREETNIELDSRFCSVEPHFSWTSNLPTCRTAHVPPRWSIIKISQKISCSTQVITVTLNVIKLNRLYIRCFLRHEVFDSIPHTWNLETLLKSKDSLGSLNHFRYSPPVWLFDQINQIDNHPLKTEPRLSFRMVNDLLESFLKFRNPTQRNLLTDRAPRF